MAMNFSPEFMVAFGAVLLLFSMRRSRRHSQKRSRGVVALSALLVETLVLLVGLSTFMVGVVILLP